MLNIIDNLTLDVQAIFENPTIGMGILDKNGAWLKVNAAFENFTGFQNDELRARNWKDLVHIPHPDLSFRNLMEDHRQGLFQYEVQCAKKDGQLCCLEFSFLPLKGVEGHYTCMAVDVSQAHLLKKLDLLERTVLEQHSRAQIPFDRVLEEYLSGIELIHPGMSCSLMRLEGDRLFVWSAKNIPVEFLNNINGAKIGPKEGSCGTAAFLKVPVYVREIATDPLWQNYRDLALESGLLACWSQPIMGKNDEVLATFAIYYTEIKSPDNFEIQTIERASRILGVILESQINLKSLKLSNQRFEYATEATSEAIWDANLIKNTVTWSSGYHTLFGYENDKIDMAAGSWSDYIHPEDFEEVNESINTTINGRSKTWTMQYRFMKADGSFMSVQDKGLVIRDEAGKAIRMVGAMRDISEQLAYEESLEKLNERLENHTKALLASNVELEQYAFLASHNLQEPLRMVSGFLEQLNNRYRHLFDEKATTYMRFAMEGAQHMRELILDFLTYAKAGDDFSPDGFNKVDTMEVLRQILRKYEEVIQRSGAEIQSGPLPEIWGKKSGIYQVFQHIIMNGIKYQPEGQNPKIQITCKPKGDCYEFSFKDNGIGIEKAYFYKIFGLFQRLHRKTSYSGTGVGLSICKKIIEKHGGEIWVESDPGKGTTFYFTLIRNKKR
jgi:PAS domain S-box-containing protein